MHSSLKTWSQASSLQQMRQGGSRRVVLLSVSLDSRLGAARVSAPRPLLFVMPPSSDFSLTLCDHSECQVRHFPSHKKSCGKRLSEAESVPIFSTSTLSQSGTPLSPFLVRQLHAQKLHPQAYWIHFVGEQVAGVTLPTYDQPDVDPVKALQSLTFHHEMLKARERAIYEKDPMSIGLVARSALDIVSAAGGIDEIGLAMSRSHRREAAKLKEAKEERSADFKRQVCTEFEITEAQLDDLMEQAELEGPDWYKTIRRSTIASRRAFASRAKFSS